MKQKILVTGASGFFGSRFVEQYKHHFDITAPTHSQLDITDKNAVFGLVAMLKPDYIIHGAAITSTGFCNQNPKLAHRVNVRGAFNIGEACQEFHSKMIFLSTEQVFSGNLEPGPYSETDTPAPNTTYGKNKLEAEKILKDIVSNLWIFRLTWLFGLPEKNCSMNPNVLWSVLQSALHNDKLMERTDEFRGLTSIHELLDHFTNLMSLPYGTYHVGSPNNSSRYDIACHIARQLHFVPDELVAPVRRMAICDIRLNTDRLAHYGIHFKSSKDALSDCIRDYQIAR